MFSDKALIIAEAGVNHNGDVNLALKLVDVAVEAGADIVKFQTFSAEDLATRDAPSAAYQRDNTPLAKSQFDMLKALELSEDDHTQIIAHCEKRGIEFLSTAFDLHRLEYLHECGVKRFKIPSGELTNLPYLERVAKFDLPIILSTGMASLAEINDALAVLNDNGVSREQITVLQCTTAYPAPVAELNLRAMQTFAEEFDCSVGFSDHSIGSVAALAARALGASVIEKHITLDPKMDGPDHAASMPPDEFKSYVSDIRQLEMALGDGVKTPSKNETENIAVARKSIVAACPIAKGEPFTTANLAVKRPGSGISPMRWHEVLNLSAPRDFEKDELIVIDT